METLEISETIRIRARGPAEVVDGREVAVLNEQFEHQSPEEILTGLEAI